MSARLAEMYDCASDYDSDEMPAKVVAKKPKITPKITGNDLINWLREVKDAVARGQAAACLWQSREKYKISVENDEQTNT